MTLAPPPVGLPKAYGGCTCSCHRIPGLKHIKACCTPSLGGMSAEWLVEKAKAEEGSDVSVGPVAALPSSPMEVVAWLHPTAGWARTSYHNILAHCRKDGPGPVALVRQDVASAAIKGLQDERDRWEERFFKMDKNFDRAIARAEAAEAERDALRKLIEDHGSAKLIRAALSQKGEQ